jgi:hypothetical protein
MLTGISVTKVIPPNQIKMGSSLQWSILNTDAFNLTAVRERKQQASELQKP